MLNTVWTLQTVLGGQKGSKMVTVDCWGQEAGVGGTQWASWRRELLKIDVFEEWVGAELEGTILSNGNSVHTRGRGVESQ